ncbi:MAG: hypothetical protein ACREPM_15675 [Gemmatimonadaceae bacterium]
MRQRSFTRAAAGAVALLAAVTTLGLARRPSPLAAPQTGMPPRDSTRPIAALGSTDSTEVSMRNVNFHAADGVVLHIRRLVGHMHGDGGIITFDDPKSYLTDAERAEVGMTGEDLTNLLGGHVFNYPGSPLSHLKIEVMPDGIRQTGNLHKGVQIPFDMTSSVSLTADGKIQLSAKRVKIFGVDGLVLMRALGLSLEKMMDLSGAHGVTVKGNDLFLDALAILPPPVIRGRLSSVRIEAGQLVQTLGDPRDTTLPPQNIDPSVKNYMLYRGGTLHFTKLYMPDAEMLVVDEDQSSPFDFDNPNYTKQLVAGHSRTLPDFGLEVWMPDAYTLSKSVAMKPR